MDISEILCIIHRGWQVVKISISVKQKLFKGGEISKYKKKLFQGGEGGGARIKSPTISQGSEDASS